MLTKIRHRNIVKLYEFCLHNRCMFLLLEYMERGSLYCILRDDIEAVELDWTKRVNIVKGIAHSLSYLHHDCKPAIIHRDVTTKNVLLNLEMKACLSDFGIARLLKSGSFNRTVLAGTYGYIAPGKLLVMLFFFINECYLLVCQFFISRRDRTCIISFLPFYPNHPTNFISLFWLCYVPVISKNDLFP